MLKIAIVLCAALFAPEANAADSSRINLSGAALAAEEFDWSQAAISKEVKPRPVVSENNATREPGPKLLEAQYNSSRRDWIQATENASRALRLRSYRILSMEEIYEQRSKTVGLYLNATAKYANVSMETISRTMGTYSSKLQSNLTTLVREIHWKTEDLIFRAGNVSECKKFSENLTTTMTLFGEGTRVLWRLGACDAGHLEEVFKLVDNAIKVLKGDIERIIQIWHSNLNCTDCEEAKEQMARGGSVAVDLAKGWMNDVHSFFLNLRNKHQTCKSNSGIAGYRRDLMSVLRKTKRCIKENARIDKLQSASDRNDYTISITPLSDGQILDYLKAREAEEKYIAVLNNNKNDDKRTAQPPR